MNLEDYLIDLDEEYTPIEAQEDITDPLVKENKERASRNRYSARNRAKMANRNRFLNQKRKLLHLDDETGD